MFFLIFPLSSCVSSFLPIGCLSSVYTSLLSMSKTGGRIDEAHEKSHENPLTSLMLTCDPKDCQGRKIASRLKIDAQLDN